MGQITHSSANLEELVDSTVNIPTVPATLMKLKEVCADDQSDSNDIAAVIEHDPAVAAKVLRLVNSSFYSLKHPCNAIPMACTIVGRRVVQNIVLQATVLDSFSAVDESPSFDINELWDHSFKTAIATQQLVSMSSLSIGLTREDAYTCGLMHDVGQIIMHQSMPDEFAAAIGDSKARGVPLSTVEREILGYSHAEVGGLLARRWKLSDELQAAIMHHHSPSTDTPEQTLGLFVHLGSSLAHQASTTAPSWQSDIASDATFDAISISGDDLAEIRETVAATKLDW